MIDFKDKIAAIIGEHMPEISLEEIRDNLELPTDAKLGDYAFPCFKLAKVMRKSPAIIASELAEKLEGNPLFEKVESVSAYVNMFLDRGEFSKEVLKNVAQMKTQYGSSKMGEGKRVLVEFSSPNIAKPFHIGHIRSTVIGHSIYKIYEFLGYDTLSLNHLGDYGTQFGKMIVAYRRWGDKAAVEAAPIDTLLDYYVKFHEEAEKDPSLEDEARTAFARLENGAEEETVLWKWFRDESLKEFNRVYDMLGIKYHSFDGESFYSDKMDRVTRELREKNVLEVSQGAEIVDLEEYGLSPALITKKDGSTLYITRDIAAAIYRKEHYGFYKNLYIVGSQQNLHFQQWIKIVDLMGYDWAYDCVHIPFGLVSLDEGTMSTREGRVVFLEDVLNKAIERTKEIILEKDVNTDNVDETARQVGIGAVIFNELSNGRIKDYVFSWDKVLNFDGETGPYVQYTNARAASVIRRAEDDLAGILEKAGQGDLDLTAVLGDAAYELARLVYLFPEKIIEASVKYEPSIVTRHIVDVAQAFNRFYHSEHILVEDEKERQAKLVLTFAAQQTMENGLRLLGIEIPERM